MEKQTVWFQDLGRMAYQEAWDYQESLLKKNIEIKFNHGLPPVVQHQAAPTTELTTKHHLLFVEHPPVYTLGKSGKMEHVLISEAELSKMAFNFSYE
jgi:lipoyl(octanoyl) transferase